MVSSAAGAPKLAAKRHMLSTPWVVIARQHYYFSSTHARKFLQNLQISRHGFASVFDQPPCWGAKKGRALPLRPMLILLAGIMGFYPASDLVFVFAKLNTLLPMSALRWCPRAGSLTGAAGQVPTPLRNVCCLVSTLCCTALPSINPPDRLPLFYLSL